MVCGLSVLLMTTPGGADPAEDAFAAGYATAVLERELAIAASVVTVKDGQVTVEVKSLASVDRDRIVAALSRIRGVTRVEVVQARAAPVGVAKGTPPGPTTTSTPTGPAVQAEVPPRGFQLLPAGRLFQPLIADPRWPHFALTYQRFLEDRQLRDVAAVSLGETIVFLRDDLAFGGQWDLGLQAGVFSIFDLDAPSGDLVNTDYMGGVPVSFRFGDFSAMLRVFHQSSHLGDEFLLRNRVDRINLSYEAVDLRASYEIGGWLRLYGGGGYLFRRDPVDLKPWLTQVGLELKSPQTWFAGHIRPVAGVDLQNREQNDWSSDLSVRAGIQLEKLTILDRKVQLLFEYFNGHSPNGQFYRNRIEYIGVGLHLYLF
jgi:hypothetical protein